MINKYEGDNTALSKLPQIFFPTNLNEIRSLDDFIGANTRSQRVVPSEASTAPMKVTLTKAENTNPNGTLSRLQNLQLDEQEQKANDESFLGDKRTTPIGPDMEDIKTKVKVEGRRKRKKHAVLVGLIGSKDASLGQDVSSRPSNSRKSRASFAAVVNTLDQPSELGATRKTPKLISFKRKISSSQYKVCCCILHVERTHGFLAGSALCSKSIKVESTSLSRCKATSFLLCSYFVPDSLT